MDIKARTENIFIELLKEAIDGIDFVGGSDRETVVGARRISVSAKMEPITGMRMSYADVEVLLVLPDTTPKEERRSLASAIEKRLRDFAEVSFYSPTCGVSVSGFVTEESADASEGQSVGDLFPLRAGIVRGDLTKQFRR